MPSLIRLTVLIALAYVTAEAAPAVERIVIADSDPELQRALTNALAPWHLKIIFEQKAPADTAEAEARATAHAARFVVWRRRGDLVVFDRERGSAEHRDGTVGVLDPASAAAAALTVKTLMRLPPPPPENDIVVGPDMPDMPAPAETGPELRTQAGLAMRVARGSETNLGARVVGTILVRPWAHRVWRFGITGDLGTRTDVKVGSFKGTWSDWVLVAVASGTIERGAWEIEPHAGIGVSRSTFDGIEMMTARDEATTLAVIRGGAWIRWRTGPWSVGGSIDLDAIPGTPTYSKLTGGNGALFSVPGFSVALGAFIAADLGR